MHLEIRMNIEAISLRLGPRTSRLFCIALNLRDILAHVLGIRRPSAPSLQNLCRPFCGLEILREASVLALVPSGKLRAREGFTGGVDAFVGEGPAFFSQYPYSRCESLQEKFPDRTLWKRGAYRMYSVGVASNLVRV